MLSLVGIILTGIVIFQLLFIAVFLFTNHKGNKLSNRLLGTVFLMLSINLLDMLLTALGLYHYFIRIALVDDGFVLAYGPLVLLYTRSVIYKNSTLSLKDLRHFIPFLVITLFLVASQNINDKAQQQQLIEDINQFQTPLFVHLAFGLFYGIAGLYLLTAYKELLNYRMVIKNKFSNVDKINLDWLSFTIKSFSVFGVIVVIDAFLPLTVFKSYFEASLVLFIGFLFYFINAVVFKALKHPSLFSGIDTITQNRYAESSLSESQLDQHKEEIINYMNTKRPYLDADLTLDQLANSLNLHPKKLSEIINRAFDSNFFQFINRYRIEEAKQLLNSNKDEKLTILEILYQSGFNSKSSFNTLFKKETGLTPSEYRNQFLNS